jgi:hypothetical protein
MKVAPSFRAEFRDKTLSNVGAYLILALPSILSAGILRQSRSVAKIEVWS